MKPIEYVTWMRGAAELCGSEPPTKEQWDLMRAKMLEAVGDLVAKRIFENAERYSEEQRAKEMATRQHELELELYTQRLQKYQRDKLYGTIPSGIVTCGSTSSTLTSTANQGYTGAALKYAAMTEEDLVNKSK